MEMSRAMDNAINEVLQCYRTCEETIVLCIETGGEHTIPEHMQIMKDCAKICAATADFMIRGSEFHIDMCDLCADICEACAESCDEFEEDFMKDCARQCERCAKSCRDMAEEEE